MGKLKISKEDRVFYKLERDRLWRKQKGICYHCPEYVPFNESTMDHITPVSLIGNQHSFDNCVMACRRCNLEKGNDPDWVYEPPKEPEWMGMINEWAAQTEQRIRQLERRWDKKPLGSFNKWQKYWTKRGRWSKTAIRTRMLHPLDPEIYPPGVRHVNSPGWTDEEKRIYAEMGYPKSARKKETV